MIDQSPNFYDPSDYNPDLVQQTFDHRRKLNQFKAVEEQFP